MKNLKIYFTSDTHGYLFPIDYATGEKKRSGLLNLIPCFEKDGNTLIIDGGDTLSGSPYTRYLGDMLNKDSNKYEQHPIAIVLNQGEYDYVTLGNHDFNFGMQQLNMYLNSLKSTCLCANVDYIGKKIKNYEIKTLENGLKVGIVGIVTDHINLWERPEHIAGVTISDPFEAAKSALEIICNQVDLTICLYHGGFEGNINTGQILSTTGENIGLRICRELNFDLMLTGHQHVAIPGQLVNETYVVQQPAYANKCLYIKVSVDKKIRFESEFLTIPSEQDVEKVYQIKEMEKIAKLEKQVQHWLDQPAGFLDKDLPKDTKINMAINGSPIADFFHQVQFNATGADISCTSLANEVKGFSKSVTTRDVLANYPYINKLVVLEVTGKDIKNILEQAVSYFDLVDNIPVVSDRFTFPKVEHFNYDYFAGIQYVADLNQPLGVRIKEIYHNNKLVKPTDKFTLATNHFRSSGTGGYTTYANCPIIKEIPTEISELIYDFIKQGNGQPIKTKRYEKNTFIF